MNISELIDVLDTKRDLMSVVDALGTYCVNNHEYVRDDYYALQSPTALSLREMVAEESHQMWDKEGRFQKGPSEELKDQIRLLDATEALATITVLEGICFGVARVYFANASSVIRIQRGSVVPLPERWLPTIAETPGPLATHQNMLDEDCNFVLWEQDWAVELDYRYRERLDLVCTIRRSELDKPATSSRPATLAYSLPKIATVHPFDGSQMTVSEPDFARSRFFRVHPKLPDGDFNDAEIGQYVRANHTLVYEALANVQDRASIAVLPEFCLHAPDGIDSLIEAGRGLPDLIVAGSAHADIENTDRANMCHVFLDRRKILVVSKQEAFSIRLPGHAGDQVRLVEDIAPAPRVVRILAGTATRLAVAICSDLNSRDLRNAFAWAGVNVLLSPSWTPRVGAFAGALVDLASTCQCICVVANTPGHLLVRSDHPPPFWAYSVVPREPCRGRDHYHEGNVPVIGVLNPSCRPGDDEAYPDDEETYWEWVT